MSEEQLIAIMAAQIYSAYLSQGSGHEKAMGYAIDHAVALRKRVALDPYVKLAAKQRIEK